LTGIHTSKVKVTHDI